MTRYRLSMTLSILVFFLSLAADATLIFTLGRTLVTPEMFDAAFGIYAFLISAPIGLLLSLLLALFTRRSFKANEASMWFVAGRSVLVWILGMVACFINDNWITPNPLDPSGAVGAAFGFTLIAGLFAQGAAFYLSSKILDAIPCTDRPHRPTSSGSFSSLPDIEGEREREKEEEYRRHWDIVNNQ